MSPTELERLALMRALAERRTTQRLVAEQFGLTVRRVERLYARFKAAVCALSDYELETRLYGRGAPEPGAQRHNLIRSTFTPSFAGPA